MNTASAITVTAKVPMTRILDMLIGAFDTSAILYWLRTEGLIHQDQCGRNHEIHWPNGVPVDPASLEWLPASEKPWNARTIYFAPLVPGGSIVLYVDPEDYAGLDRVVLDLTAIRGGVQVMAEKYPRHFADMMNEDDDAITHDVFVQCAVFGEVIYG